MIKFSKLAAAVALVVAGSAAHAVAVIDDFSVGQARAEDLTTGGVAVWSPQTAFDAGILGGYRDLWVNKTADSSTNGSLGVRAIVINGALSYAQDSAGSAGTGHVVWDGKASGAGLAANDYVTTNGLGGTSLLGLGTGIRVKVIAADIAFPFSFNVWTDDANNGSYLLHTATTNAAVGAGTYDLFFTGFGGADFSRVGAVELVLNDGGSKANIDIDIDFIGRIPEPGTLALVGAAILGLGAARRRKNAA